MFRIILMGIQSFVYQQVQSLLQMQNPALIAMFDKFLKNEISLFKKLYSYGKLKGWVYIPPSYNPSS